MKMLSLFVKFFIYITTVILIVCAINFQISGQNLIPMETLWRILLSGFLTIIVTMLFSQRKQRKVYNLHTILYPLRHFVHRNDDLWPLVWVNEFQSCKNYYDAGICCYCLSAGYDTG